MSHIANIIEMKNSENTEFLNKIPSHVLGMPAQWVCLGFWNKSNKPSFSIWMRFLQVNRGHIQRNTVT